MDISGREIGLLEDSVDERSDVHSTRHGRQWQPDRREPVRVRFRGANESWSHPHYIRWLGLVGYETLVGLASNSRIMCIGGDARVRGSTPELVELAVEHGGLELGLIQCFGRPNPGCMSAGLLHTD